MDHAQIASNLISQRVENFIGLKRKELRELGADITPLIDEAESFTRGGKRLRGQFLITGFKTIRNLDLSVSDNPATDAVLTAAAALELFHAAALVHDDIIDDSATRRGRPSVHESMSSLHRSSGYSGDPKRFGVSGAILLGDMLQSWADEAFQNAIDAVPSAAWAESARKIFNTMRSEVAAGQFLDVLEEARPNFAEHSLQLERSTKVLVYKSAKYSVQAPLMIGAALAGANETELLALEGIGLPIGVAFQLRDDVLGAFGNEKVTGKPAGDDLREGKRTVLVTLARENLPGSPQRVFDDLLGDLTLDEFQIATLQKTIIDSGALESVETMISRNAGIAREKIRESTFRDESKEELLALADRATVRDS